MSKIKKLDAEKISQIFKIVRITSNLDQKQIAKKLKITQGTVSKIEAGEMTPNLELWYTFVKTFKIDDPFCFDSDRVYFFVGKFLRCKELL